MTKGSHTKYQLLILYSGQFMLSTELIILNYPVISRLNLLSVLEDAKHKKEGKNSQTANDNRSHDPTGQTT